MEDKEKIIELLIQLGLKLNEVNNLSPDNLKTYVKFYHGKSYETSSVRFIGFGVSETILLTKTAMACKFKVLSKSSNEYVFTGANRVAFLCASYSVDKQIIDKAKEVGTIVLSQDYFEEFKTNFFSDNEEIQNGNEFLFDSSI